MKAIQIACNIFLVSLITGCSMEEKEGNGEENTLVVEYGSGYSEDRTVLSTNDTLFLNLFDSCYLFVQSSYDSVVYAFDKEHVAMEEVFARHYCCIPRSTGITTILFFAYSLEGTSTSYREVDLEIEKGMESYYVANNSYVIEVAGAENLFWEIYLKLGEHFPQTGSSLVLEYVNRKEGGFTYLKKDVDTAMDIPVMEGTFSVTDTDRFNLVCEEWQLDFVLLQEDDGSRYTFEQDLTQEFRAMYPLYEITKVGMTSEIIKQSPN